MIGIFRRNGYHCSACPSLTLVFYAGNYRQDTLRCLEFSFVGLHYALFNTHLAENRLLGPVSLLLCRQIMLTSVYLKLKNDTLVNLAIKEKVSVCACINEVSLFLGKNGQVNQKLFLRVVS